MTSLLTPILGSSLVSTAAFWFNSIPRGGNMIFGRHVAPEWLNSPPGRRVVMVFRAQLIFWMLAATALAFTPAFMGAIAVPAAGGMLAFYIANAAAKKHSAPAAGTRTASLAPDNDSLPGGVTASIIPPLIPVVAALLLRSNGPSTYVMLGAAAFCSLLFVLIAVGILRTAARSDATRRRAMVRMLVGLAWVVSISFTLQAIKPALKVELSIPVNLAITAATILATAILIWPVLRASRGGAEDGTPDSAWKWGIFYYNPSDPALLVERRLGIGYTFNFANKISWLLTAVLALPPVVLFMLKR